MTKDEFEKLSLIEQIGVTAPMLNRQAEIDELKQQLAAALAVCMVKDEAIASQMKVTSWEEQAQANDLSEEALAIQPDDSALKAWLGEPVFIRRDQLLKVRESPFLCRLETIQRDVGWIPLYAPKGMK